MTVLDEAYERLGGAWLENQRGFVNHGAMVCEALFTMGFDSEVLVWADRSALPRRDSAERLPKGAGLTEWREALGEFSKLDEWVTHFELAIHEFGWRDTIALWVPRLMPSLGSMLFHALIRTAHATRAVDGLETEPRLQELAFSLGYWAARYGYGRRPALSAAQAVEPESDVSYEASRAEIAHIACGAARRYVSGPDVFTLHGVTGAMAVHLLVPYLPPAAAFSTIAQLDSVQREVFGNSVPLVAADTRELDRSAVAIRAESTGNVHAVKLVEAALRGLDATGDPVFAEAAELVTSGS